MKERMMTVADSLTFSINVPAAGDYGVRLRYSSRSSLQGDGSYTQMVNGAAEPPSCDRHGEYLGGKAGRRPSCRLVKTPFLISATGGDTAANVKIDLIGPSLFYKGEKAQLSNGIRIENNHSRFSEEGFIQKSGPVSTGRGRIFKYYIYYVRLSGWQTAPAK